MKGLKIAVAALTIACGVQASSLWEQAKGIVNKGKTYLDKGTQVYNQYAPQVQGVYDQGKALVPQVKDYALKAQNMYDTYGHLLPTNTLREGANTLFSTLGERAGR
jgi:hypothetical protein